MAKKKKVDTPRRICTASSKGGVTKTSTTLELAAQLATMGDTVLILDLDSSSDLSTKLGLFDPEDESTNPPLTLINAIVSDKRDQTKLRDIILETPYENLLIAPSDAGLGEEFIAMKGLPRKKRPANCPMLTALSPRIAANKMMLNSGATMASTKSGT